MKTVKITKQQVEVFQLMNQARQAANAATKQQDDYKAQLKAAHTEIENGEEVAFMFNGQVIATNQVTERQAVSQTLLKTDYPDVYKAVSVVTKVATLKVMLN